MRTYRSAITWTDTSDTASQRVHLLSVPLRDAEPAVDQAVFTRQSLDRSVIESFVVESGAHDLVGTVRYDRDAQSLIDLIQAGARNITLIYIPELNDPARQYACKLVSPRTPAAITADGDTGEIGEHSIQLKLRKTDESRFEEAYQGTDVLFGYRAGGTLAAATHSRTGTAGTVVTHTGGDGWGTVSTAASGAARTEWISTVSTGAVRTVPTLLLEQASTNLVEQSHNFGSQWQLLTTKQYRTSGYAAPDGTTGGVAGNGAWRLRSSGTASIRSTSLGTMTSGTTYGVSIYLKNGVGALGSSETDFGVADGAGLRSFSRITWGADGTVPSQTVFTGTSFAPPELVRNGFWRFTQTVAPSLSGTTWQFRIWPTVGNTTGEVIAWGAQVE